MAPDYRSGLDEMLGGNPWLQDRLSFEITESSKIEDLCAANEYVLDLRARGYEMCLDDFGAGAANFQYLASLDVDIVKFDGGAVRAARRSGKGLAFLKSLVGLCQRIANQHRHRDGRLAVEPGVRPPERRRLRARLSVRQAERRHRVFPRIIPRTFSARCKRSDAARRIASPA